MPQHELHVRLRVRHEPFKVLVVGAGGTGSQVLTALAQLDHALRSLGRPGLQVTCMDGDRVSEANVGRQMFFPADVGHYKSEVLIHRINMTMRTSWDASIAKLKASDRVDADIVIGCVDTRAARFAIMRAIERGGAMSYWLDFGNGKDHGQVVLGQVSGASCRTNPRGKLPHVGELFPEAIDFTLDAADDQPSCSLAEALERQSLFINRAVTVHGMNLLWQLLRHFTLEHHGVFVNLATGQARPIPVDPEYWASFGYGSSKRKVRRKTIAAQSAASAMH